MIFKNRSDTPRPQTGIPQRPSARRSSPSGGAVKVTHRKSHPIGLAPSNPENFADPESLAGINPNPSLTAHGCSLGASHAVNIAFRHPHLFTHVLALSGRYDLARDFGGGFRDLFDGYYDDNVYSQPFHT
jgi:S-formylglutathione hydrolase FrmB